MTMTGIREQLADAILTGEATYAELAERSGVDPAILCRLATGQATVRLENAERIAEALGLRLVLEPVKGKKRKGATR